MIKLLFILAGLMFPLTIFSQTCIDGDCQNGKGTYKMEGGEIYSGDFKNGKFDGSEALFSEDGKSGYIGEFKDGVFHGKGKFRGESLDYEGDFEKGDFHGNGVLTFTNGTEYTGQFKAGYWYGKGTITYKNGESYTGDWKENMRHGIGKQTFVSNPIKQTFDWYKGEFKHDSINGKGIFCFSFGVTFKGNFVDGELVDFDGYLFALEDSIYYKGFLKDGVYEGQGTLKYSNGDIYIGGFKEGSFEGAGVYTYANGTKLDGYFRKGEFILAK